MSRTGPYVEKSMYNTRFNSFLLILSFRFFRYNLERFSNVETYIKLRTHTTDWESLHSGSLSPWVQLALPLPTYCANAAVCRPNGGTLGCFLVPTTRIMKIVCLP